MVLALCSMKTLLASGSPLAGKMQATLQPGARSLWEGRRMEALPLPGQSLEEGGKGRLVPP